MIGMVRMPPVLLLWAASFAAAQDLAPEVLLLQRVRIKAAQNLTRLPNYTCLQTIERSLRPGPKKKPQIVDTVRLEVALVNGKELFAWPGSRRFQDTEIRKLVVSGAIGTGSFAGLAKSVFQTRGPQFHYVGLEERNGRMCHRWDYVVPQLSSGYRLRVGDQEAVVGYHGSFWIDPESLDLRRLEAFADNIPPRLQLAAAAEAIEYARVRIHEESFLLPSLAEMQLTGEDGVANLNRTTFGSCRQYAGASTLLFDDPDQDLQPLAAQRAFEVPPGIRLDVQLETPVPLATSAVGDPISAVLRKPVKLMDGIVAPKGAVLRGRVTHVSRQNWQRYAGYNVGLSFSELEWENTVATLQARLGQVTLASPQVYVFESQRQAAEERIMGSIFFVRTNIAVTLPKGMQMTWYTAPGKVEDPK